MKRDLDLNGYRLNSIRLSGAALFEFANGPSPLNGPPPNTAAIHIGAHFLFESADGSCLVEPDSWKNVERIRPLLGQTVTSAVATEEGELTVAFTGGHRITIRNETQYEPWDFRKDDGTLVVAVPGGDLAIWSPSPRPAHPVNRKPGKRRR